MTSATQPLRDVLTAIFAEILSVDASEVDPGRTFDRFGLDSIDAVIASGKVAEVLGTDLPPEFLLQHRTIDEVVATLSRDQRFGDEAERPGAANTPTFLFGGGRDGRLQRLARRAFPAVNFANVPLGEWRQWIADGTRFDSLVESSCLQIEAEHPDGPVRLAGYSQGGQLAFATAVALTERGRTVESLTLIDSVSTPGSQGAMLNAPKGITGRLRALRKGLARLAWPVLPRVRAHHQPGAVRIRAIQRLYAVLHRSAAGQAVFARLMPPARALFTGRTGVRLDVALQLQMFQWMWDAWLVAYRGKPKFVARAVLFRANSPGPADRGWGGLCSSLQVVHVPGGHLSMFDEPYMDDLAIRFAQALDPGSANRRKRNALLIDAEAAE